MAVFTGNGAAATPSFTFSSDTDTGIFRSADNTISFTTTGVERANIDSAGAFNVNGTNIVLAAAGTITSVDNIQAGGNPANASNDGVRVMALGKVQASNSGAQGNVFEGFRTDGGSTDPTCTVRATGAVIARGDVEIGDTSAGGTGEGTKIFSVGSVTTTRAGATNTVWEAYLQGDTESTSQITAEGDAEFLGDLTIGTVRGPDLSAVVSGTDYVISVTDGTFDWSTVGSGLTAASAAGTSFTATASASLTSPNTVALQPVNGDAEFAGNVTLEGDIINAVTNGDQDIICNGEGLVKLTEYNLNPMEVVTKHDIGTGAGEVPVNGFLGTLAYTDDLATRGGLTVANLPASPIARVGDMNFVTDGTASLSWGATVTGGGTAQYLVWYNGTNWTVIGA